MDADDTNTDAKKALTSFSEATACNTVVGLPSCCTGAKEGIFPKKLTAEPLHKDDSSGDFPTNDDHVCETNVVMEEERVPSKN